jgi:hypothetical protein
MIWFQTKEFEKKISNNQFSEKDGYNYLLATSIYGFVFAYYATIGQSSYLTAFICVSHILITLVGFPALYKINKKLDNKDFIQRYLAITWIIRMKILVLMIFSTLILLNIFGSGWLGPSVEKLIIILISISFSLIYYGLAIRSFKRLTTVQP